MFVIPKLFNRNSPEVQAMGPPADTGLRMIRYMCERIGIPDLSGLDILDFGCGSRFADAIITHNVPLRTYVGIDVYKEMINFLSENATDPRLSFFHINARNPGVNPEGDPLTADTRLPIGDRMFDLICMFSVITHQIPEDTLSIFRIIRKYVKESGFLFFSAYLEKGDFGYREHRPEAPTALSIYSLNLLEELLGSAKWKVISVAPPLYDELVMDSFLCAPA
jgi:Methyltransferase domain.